MLSSNLNQTNRMEYSEAKKIFFIEKDSCESLEFDPKDFYDVTLPANDRVQRLIDDVIR